MGYFILIGVLLLLLLPGLYCGWKYRHDGGFKIEEIDEEYWLWYHHRGQWMFDSVHDTEEEANDRIKFYLEHKAGRGISRGKK